MALVCTAHSSRLFTILELRQEPGAQQRVVGQVPLPNLLLLSVASQGVPQLGCGRDPYGGVHDNIAGQRHGANIQTRCTARYYFAPRKLWDAAFLPSGNSGSILATEWPADYRTEI